MASNQLAYGCPNAPKWLPNSSQMAPKWLPNGSKTAQDCSKTTSLRSKMASNGFKMFQDIPKMPQDAPRWPPNPPRWVPNGPSMAQDGLKIVSNCLKNWGKVAMENVIKKHIDFLSIFSSFYTKNQFKNIGKYIVFLLKLRRRWYCENHQKP